MDENNNPIQESGVKTEERTTETTQNLGQKKVNSMALISFIFSLVGLVVAGLPCGIVALITGITGLVKYDASKEKFKWMAIVGIVVGVIDIVAVVLNIILTAATLS